MNNILSYKLTEKKISISELSRVTGISRTTITDLVKQRKRNLTFSKAKKIADCLSCSVAEIFPELNSTQKETA
ncbi:MAG: helix-turn-helix transcriptional regulator [Ruminococcus sp.]|nr:helix-turn-helix transcriptional regulator [Ruminococcus sp.]